MFDIGWQELFIILVLTVIVVGPKELPRTARTVTGWLRKARRIAREFQSSVDDMVREADLDDIKKQVEATANLDIAGELKKELDPDGELAGQIDMKEIGSDIDGAVADVETTPAPATSGDQETEPGEAPAETAGEAEDGAATGKADG